MAVSKDAQQFNIPAAICFGTMLNLLPNLSIKVAPFCAALPRLESQTFPEIRARVQIDNAYYRLKIICDEIQPQICTVKMEAATTGLTDLGLGLMTVRQLMAVLRLTLEGRLPNLPAFFRPPTPANPLSPQAYYEALVNSGFDYSKKGMGDNSLVEFESALKFNPQGVEAYFHRGMLYLILGRLEEAETDFEVAVRFAPEHLLAKLYLQDTVTKLAQKRATAISQTVLTPARPHISTDTNPSQPSLTVKKKSKSKKNEDEPTVETPKLPDPNRHYLRSSYLNNGVFEINQPLTTIGRHETNTISLKDGRISRVHAEIHYHKTFCVIKDLASTNGTFVNDKPLNPGDLYTLSNQAKISFGGLEMVYTCAYEPEISVTGVEVTTEKIRRLP
jgi:tetratricopeptide (TPR) repeat protein